MRVAEVSPAYRFRPGGLRAPLGGSLRVGSPLCSAVSFLDLCVATTLLLERVKVRWMDFLRALNDDMIASACSDIDAKFGKDTLQGKRILDIGSGSGVHSLCFWLRDPELLVSVDVDPASIQATISLKHAFGLEASARWTVRQGSVLNLTFMESLGEFDIVYSWGVLHHSGFMWRAISQAADRCAPKCVTYIALYAKTPEWVNDLFLKRVFNCATKNVKRLLIDAVVERKGGWEVMRERKQRGMLRFYDVFTKGRRNEYSIYLI